MAVLDIDTDIDVDLKRKWKLIVQHENRLVQNKKR